MSKLVICKSCGKEIVKGAKCLSCGNDQRNFFMKHKTMLQDIKKLGLNTVNVPVVININSLSSSDMSIDISSKKRAISLIKILKEKHINVILEPYPWISNGSLPETTWKPTDINAFFWNWKTKVLKSLIKRLLIPMALTP